MNAALSHARDGFRAALRRGDAEAAAEFYVADAVVLSPSVPPVRGRPGVQAFWQAGIDAGIADAQFRAIEVSAAELAYEFGDYSIRVVPTEGEPVIEYGQYVRVQRRLADGTWGYALEMLGPDGSPVVDRRDRTEEERT